MTEENTPKMNYPGNSNKDKAGKPDKNIQQVTSVAAVQRKKSIFKRIGETFSGDDAQSVGSYILFDVIIPAAKNMLSDAVSQGIERLLFGESSRRSGSRRNGGSYTSYNRMYSGGGSSSSAPWSRDRDEPRQISKRARAQHDFDEIILQTRGEAEEVLDRLGDLIDNYEVATVSDLYELVGITGSYVDDKWGWMEISSANVQQVRAGFLLNLPRPVPID